MGFHPVKSQKQLTLMEKMKHFRIIGDYSFFQKAIPLIGLFGIFGNFGFYFILKFGFHYWESLLLRGMVMALSLGLIFFPKEKPLSTFQKIYFEISLFIELPILFTLFFLKNDCNIYWYASIIFSGLLYGLSTRPIFYFWAYPLGVGFSTFIFMYHHSHAQDLTLKNLQAQLIAYFLGALTNGIKTTLEHTHEKIMQATLALAKAENDLALAESTRLAYEELKLREEMIRVYVRPSLVDEIRAGKDPSKFAPVMRELSVMFCDIRDFTRLTEILTPYEKQTFLNQYFSMMTHPIAHNGGEVDKIMGDCVMGLFPSGSNPVQAAIDMRLELQKFNGKMYELGQHKILNGIGIAKGEVMQGNFGSFEKLDRTVIGEAVNIASRLEAKTKMYNLDIVVTENVIEDWGEAAKHFRWIDLVQVKGSTRSIKLFEIYGHQPDEVIRFKDETRDLFEKALTIYFRKGFKDASRLFHAMLEKVPPHRLFPNQLMDNLLPYYIAHCENWINDKTGSWEKIEKWDGVHIFYEK